ncbi:MAG: I78 family peptidase inhibitor [Pseudomonadota bacterium]
MMTHPRHHRPLTVLCLCLAAVTAVGACYPKDQNGDAARTPDDTAVVTADTDKDPCGASAMQDLVGQHIDDVTLPVGLQMRVFTQSQPVTMDFIETRLNVLVSDTDGSIVRVSCG